MAYHNEKTQKEVYVGTLNINKRTNSCVSRHTQWPENVFLLLKSVGMFKSTIYQVSTYRHIIIYCSENTLEMACGNANKKHTSFYLNNRPKKVDAVFLT